MIKVGYLGPAGSFSEEAANIYIENAEEYKKIEYPNIQSLITDIGINIDEAIVPLENSIEGSVNITIDLLIKEKKDIKIKGEIVLPVKHCLFAKKMYPLENIKIVYSHPQALYQCREFLYSRMPGAVIKESGSTSRAAKKVLQSQIPCAAIGSRRLSEIYNLLMLAEDIQDCAENYTRFIVLSKEDESPTGSDKTSLVFSTENKPGRLYRVLGFFAEENINLTKIESRPSKRILGEYIFFLEVEGHREDKILKKVLEKVKENSTFYKLLGSYPKGKEYYPPSGGDQKEVKG
ncbi:prephenate dehydratase [Thermovenabulum sp.]|uniref:prephenate dehydratase n=1 Tax=Thermovenabulum sp. TaxID=3100335 RepID=UPI003C7DCDD3